MTITTAYTKNRTVPVQRGDVTLYYQDIGSGPVVVLHTGGCGDGRMWEMAGYVSLFGAYRCLLMDHRGHGRSSLPMGMEAHRIQEYVADVIAVLDDAVVERAAFVGYSAGATVGYHVAAAHPERVGALVDLDRRLDDGDYADDDLEIASRIRREGVRALVAKMAAAEGEAPPEWLVDNLSETESEMFAIYVEAWSGRADEWPLLPQIDTPTLVIAGGDDPEVPVAVAGRLQRGTAAHLPGFGHLQAFWRTDVTGPLITGFLSQV